MERLRNPKIKGVLVSCDVRFESLCASECIMAFTEYAQMRYPDLFSKEEQGGAAAAAVDVEAAIAAEAAKEKEERHFQSVNTGVKGLVFIEFTHTQMSPLDLCSDVVKQVKATGHTKTKYAVRMTPVLASSYASIDNISKAVEPLLSEYLGAGAEATSYSIVFKKRSNDLNRVELIDKVAGMVDKKHKVDLTTPKICLLVDVLTNNCLLGIAYDYFGLRKFNIQELAGIGIKETDKKEGGGEGERVKAKEGKEEEGKEEKEGEEKKGEKKEGDKEGNREAATGDT